MTDLTILELRAQKAALTMAREGREFAAIELMSNFVRYIIQRLSK